MCFFVLFFFVIDYFLEGIGVALHTKMYFIYFLFLQQLFYVSNHL